MKKQLSRKLSMYQMVRDTLDDNQTVWAGTPKFVSAVNTFKERHDFLLTLTEQQQVFTLGVRETRDQKRENVANIAFRIGSALRSLAAEQGDLELFSRMKITMSDLTKGSQTKTMSKLDTIRLAAVENAEALVEFGISAELLAEFLLKRDELAVKILAPRKAIIGRKDISAQIDSVSNAIDAILKVHVDNLVTVLRPSNESFFTLYFDARHVPALGSHKSQGNSSNNQSNTYE